MNTYRVAIRLSRWNRTKEYDVDASRPGAAIQRALAGFPDADVVEANCTLYRKHINRHYGDPKVRAV